MFEILYRITDSDEELAMLAENTSYEGGDVLGFFEINVNGYHYGYYHNYPLQPGEFWNEQITNWFIVLIHAYQELNRSGYVLISLLDAYPWIELRKVQEMVEINILLAEKPDGTTELRLTPLEEFEYDKWYIQYVKDGELHSESVDRRDESVKLDKMRAELLRKALQYLDELRDINPKLLRNERIAELNSLISCLK